MHFPWQCPRALTGRSRASTGSQVNSSFEYASDDGDIDVFESQNDSAEYPLHSITRLSRSCSVASCRPRVVPQMHHWPASSGRDAATVGSYCFHARASLHHTVVVPNTRVSRIVACYFGRPVLPSARVTNAWPMQATSQRDTLGPARMPKRDTSVCRAGLGSRGINSIPQMGCHCFLCGPLVCVRIPPDHACNIIILLSPCHLRSLCPTETITSPPSQQTQSSSRPSPLSWLLLLCLSIV